MQLAKHSLHDRKTDVLPKAKPLLESAEDLQLSSPGAYIYFLQPRKTSGGPTFSKRTK